MVSMELDHCRTGYAHLMRYVAVPYLPCVVRVLLCDAMRLHTTRARQGTTTPK